MEEKGKRSMSSTKSVYCSIAKKNPSNKEMELLEEYHCDRLDDVVENNIDKEILKHLPQVKEMISNLEKYGDSKIYKVLPKELNDKMKAYGIDIVENYILRQVRNDRECIVVPSNYRQCSCCGRYLQYNNNFYGINNADGPDLRKAMLCCKNCADNIFKNAYRETGDLKESLVLISQKLDIITFDEIINKYIDYMNTLEGKIAFRNGTYIGLYIADCQILADRNSIEIDKRDFAHSEIGGPLFKDFSVSKGFNEIYPVEELDNNSDTGEERPVSDYKRLKREWGNSFSKADLEWLESKQSEWYSNYDIVGKSRELLVQQLCLEELQLFKARNKGEDCSKKLKNIQDLLKSSDLTPKNTDIQDPSQKFGQFGEFIKHVETEEPFINKDPQFEDVDGIYRLWRQIVGALERTAGKDGEEVKEFEENMKDYTVDFVKEDEDDGS